MKKSATIRRPASDSYMALIRRLPLRPIRNDRDYTAAVGVLNRLALRDEGTLDPGEQDYLETLTLLVESYDDRQFRIDTSDVTPLELLKHLMENRQMSVGDLGRVVGSQPLASMILAGTREISRDKRPGCWRRISGWSRVRSFDWHR